MPRWLRGLLLVIGLAWIAAVYGPYLKVPSGGQPGTFLGGDLQLLADAAGGQELTRGEAEPLPLQEMDASSYAAAGGERGSVLSGASLALSRRLWGVTASSAILYRLENLLLLLAAGLGLANLVRRLLLPWTGADHARAAARALPAVLLLHPLSVQAVVDLGGRSELLYLALAAWAGATYLRARQDRRLSHVLLAVVLAGLASLAGRSGLGLALVVGVAEFASVQRYQARAQRLRRGLGAGLLVLLVSSLDSALRWLSGSGGLGGISPFGAGSPLERLGVLVVPVPVVVGTPSSLTGLLVALATVLFLTSMHPALRAARWAPRLWGWLLGGWFAALFLAALGGDPVEPGDFSRAETLLPAVAILVSGMVVVATGVQGFRRLLLPVVLALGFGLLSFSQVGHHDRAAAVTAKLRADLELGLAEAEQSRTSLAARGFSSLEGPAILVVESAEERSARDGLALDPLAGGIGHLLDGSLRGVTSLGPQDAHRRPVLLSEGAFLALAREPEFDRLREGGVVVLLDRGLGHRSVQALPPPEPAEAPPAWRGDASSPDLDLDPFRTGALVVNLPGDPLPSTGPPAPEVRFLPGTGGADRVVPGAWLGDRGPAAGVFDLSSELDYLLTERVARMWLASGVARVESCELLPDLPGAADTIELVRDGGDWVTALPSLGRLRAPAEATWRLELLGLGSYRYEVLVARAGEVGRLRFVGAAELLDAWPGEEVAWSLVLAVGDRRIWRHRGRVQ